MKDTECIGIRTPVISVEAESREEFKGQNIKLRDVEFADSKTRKTAVDDPMLDEYLEMFNVLKTYTENMQKEMGGK